MRFKDEPRNTMTQQDFCILRHHFAISMLLLAFLFFSSSCTFPVRTGYDRKIGAYKPVPSANSKQVSQEKPKQTTPNENSSQAAPKNTTQPQNKVQETATAKTSTPPPQPEQKKSVATAPKQQAKAAPSKKFSSLKEYTDSWNGTKYVYGGSSRSGTDCSGYIMNIFRDVYGVDLPHSASTIYDDSRFSKVSRDDLKEGDLVFFGDFWGISHIGIYMGSDNFSHASTSKGVMTSKLSDKYWDSRYKGGRRLNK